MTESSRQLPPVIILGGEANALSVARDLGRMGVTVYAMGEADSTVRASRYCTWIDVPLEGSLEDSWARCLLSDQAEYLRGAVVLSCSDAGLLVLARHRAKLLERYRLDDSETAAQLLVLDKLTTYKRAKEAGVPTPAFWETQSRDEIVALRDELVFPLMIKPRLSHLFEEKFGRKHVVVETFDQLLAAYDRVSGGGLELLLMEQVPGGDDCLCSYYTYLDEASRPLFHFTKRIIRRYPTGMGAACYHVTDRVPEIGESGNRLFKHVGLRGLANIEFKRDPRDGVYKLIECNARFTASNCLVSASGVRLAEFVYNRLAGRPLPEMDGWVSGKRLWDPARDFKAFCELRGMRRLSLVAWFKSVLHRQTFAYFAWSDPMPAVARVLKPLKKLFKAWDRKQPLAKGAGQGALA
jgi:predicted ATP-grasp superfamily ATP-dependent carboligase